MQDMWLKCKSAAVLIAPCLICPMGSFEILLSSLFAKIIPLVPSGKSVVALRASRLA
jgi:hypothetical protein